MCCLCREPCACADGGGWVVGMNGWCTRLLTPCSDSYRCFMETVLAREPLHLEVKTGAQPMRANVIEQAWLAAFESNDPAKGGCAPVLV